MKSNKIYFKKQIKLPKGKRTIEEEEQQAGSKYGDRQPSQSNYPNYFINQSIRYVVYKDYYLYL